MKFIDYFKEKESDLIKVIGEKDWKENKMYFVDEILSMVADWQLKNSKFIYEPTNQDILSKGTIIYNFDTKEEDVIVDYKNGRSSITAKGRHFHVSANVLGGGWKAVRKTYI